MKIAMNFELIDKAREAKSGYSLRKHIKVVGSCMALYLPLLSIDATVGDKSPIEIAAKSGFWFLYYCGYSWFSQKARAGLTKDRAENELRQLSYRLRDIYVDTNTELLQGVTCYKTEYKVQTDSFMPKIEERKFLTVPVNSDWDNNTRSLVQEHILGTREYALSHGEPEEKKVYSLGIKKMMQK